MFSTITKIKQQSIFKIFHCRTFSQLNSVLKTLKTESSVALSHKISCLIKNVSTVQYTMKYLCNEDRI